MFRSRLHRTKDPECDIVKLGLITDMDPDVPQTWIKTINPSGRLLVSGDIVERLSVKSRILRSVGYDDSTKILEIEFSSGYVYQYSGVPPKIYADLMHSDEIGKFFSEKVRPKFQTKQVGA
ncbi:MAG: KTSC domain-containing protein [Methanoregula sp.]|jgi:hypothetical protein